MNSAQSIFNVIRIRASERYQDAVPALTDKDPIGKVTTPILDNPLVYKEFTSLLGAFMQLKVMNMDEWDNPLSNLIVNGTPLGEFGAVIGAEIPAPKEYDPLHPERLLNVAVHDDYVSYYVRNVREFIKYTLVESELMGAFDSYDRFNSYVAMKIAAARTAAQKSMYNHIMESIVDNNNAGVFVKSDVKLNTTTGNYSKWTIAAKDAIDYFQYPSDNFNNYSTLSRDGRAFEGFTKVDDIYIIATINWVNSADVDFLANLFNITKGELEKRIVKIPEFAYDSYEYDENGEVTTKTRVSSNIGAIICDRNLFIYTKDLSKYNEFENPEILATNFYIHQWLTYGINPLANCLVFEMDEEPEPVVYTVAPKGATLTFGSGDDVDITVKVDDVLATGYTTNITVVDTTTGENVELDDLSSVVTVVDDEAGTITVTAVAAGTYENVLVVTVAIDDDPYAVANVVIA